MASLQFNLERVPTLFLSVCLPLGAGGSRGRLRSVRAGSRSPARPPRGAALSPKEGGVELYYLLWTEGGKQEPSSAAGFDCCSQHGTHRGDTNTHTHTYTPLMYNTVWYRIYNHIVGCVCVCVCRWSHTYWTFQRKMKKGRRDLRSTHMTVYGERQVMTM